MIKNNIVIISYAYPPGMGGIETVAETLRQELRPFGCTIVTNTPSSACHDPEIFRRPAFGTLLKILGAARFIVVNHPSLRLTWPLLFWRRPHVVQIHHTPFTVKETLASTVTSFLKRLFCLALGRNCFVSKSLQKAQALSGTVIYNPVRLGLGNSRAGSVNRPVRLLFMGRLTPVKAPDRFIDLISRLRAANLDVEAHLMGQGELSEVVGARISQSGLEDILQRGVTRTTEEARAQYDWADLVIIPSRTGIGFPAEGLPMVALEAKTRGAVVIGTASGGLPEAIGQGGIVVDDDFEQLYQACHDLVTDPQRLASLSLTALEEAKAFQPQTVINALLPQLAKGAPR